MADACESSAPLSPPANMSDASSGNASAAPQTKKEKSLYRCRLICYEPSCMPYAEQIIERLRHDSRYADTPLLLGTKSSASHQKRRHDQPQVITPNEQNSPGKKEPTESHTAPDSAPPSPGRASADRREAIREIADFCLHLDCDGLSLTSEKFPCALPFRIDYLAGSLGWRLNRPVGFKEPLSRALGMHRRRRPIRIIDTTFGMGRDAMVLARLGCRIMGYERSTILALLVEDAMMRARMGSAETGSDQRDSTQQGTENGVAQAARRISLISGDARVALKRYQDQQESNAAPCDAILLDPMFPHRSKSALVKQEMRLIRALVGEDDDADALLRAALNSGTGRIVVKRPARAAGLVQEPRPSHSVSAGQIRYDVYLCATAS